MRNTQRDNKRMMEIMHIEREERGMKERKIKTETDNESERKNEREKRRERTRYLILRCNVCIKL